MWPILASNPRVESCPHCLNHGGTLAACGLIGNRNYDDPKNSLGGPMGPNIQAVYSQGAEIDIDIALTAHHKGHFSFYACPVMEDGSTPSNDCFQDHPLEFVEDYLYGATIDPQYPERAYIPPLGHANPDDDPGAPVAATIYSYRMKLPENVIGSRVLLQWHYLTANSCVHEGYSVYSFPQDWPSLGYNELSLCNAVPPDGRGVPEQFWNCAEVKINENGAVPPPSPPTSSSTLAPAVYPAPSPVSGRTDTPTGIPVANEAPVGSLPTTNAPYPGLILSTSMRCGASELDARGNCGQECTSDVDCSGGEWCWGVQSNYCGTKPFQSCPDLAEANADSRCGASELDARELCGSRCTFSSECDENDFCWPTHMNILVTVMSDAISEQFQLLNVNQVHTLLLFILHS